MEEPPNLELPSNRRYMEVSELCERESSKEEAGAVGTMEAKRTEDKSRSKAGKVRIKEEV